MTNYSKLPAILVLEDGTVYHGKAAGKIGTTTGEICFNTGTTGYQEIFTDPSYFGQIMVTTNAHIGNYGIDEDDTESGKIQIAGLVCKNYNINYSRKMADESIQSYFEEGNLVGISDIDTRSLVRHIRNKGAMNAIISSENLDVESLKATLATVPSMDGLELSSQVSTTEPYFYGNEDAPVRVAVLDLGIKKNILRNFDQREVYAKVFPAKTTFAEMQEWNPAGYFISNGPGDPSAMSYAIQTVKDILAADQPMFGICLGHQILALANDIRTQKMHNGHRGINHPVKNIIANRCEITSQNHGFGVVAEDIEQSDKVEVTHINLNDQSIEGIRVIGKNAFSVQYHPESSPGPHDSRYLFDDFIELIKK
ncbi:MULTISPECIES: glutamine-hydrolyzing carbamoyl-phosphate synthase small subunit [Sphingobacterium]|jgi:carbamoyl-phosphate synthase small subunit|uniref:glutamine-hydrolyzing carbamoyl-phosphate synthase small subunit n=1 Tax=Sphingobacterium TaxID=28453 RepID=UPI0004E601DF|nr:MULTISPECIES: glutamine-hydrolyzing carbamoyl-phosphate synthase small subunit [Sphingobacterium]CDS91984.1 Carbamoyl-phosphate synthase small chain [Sphingobacterium sp. PM2-P1-29]SJN52420.1 Carbamoyl-phosphate synthase small chain [Sphingobacterium faecium PCAi_F2.5]PTX13770.1 carbamoyl-phosphate synthase small subunit [Sphingobacterium faecium]UPZ36162.1 glutamine-hydrolyzing carbamoyl-phosphate synthase small subunit [Sphingobacterium sp. PCS056]UXD71697.1 glutamine-hydrolyzing carbamoy